MRQRFNVDPANSCDSKVRYETITAAQDAIVHLSYRDDVHAYGCRFCGGAHVGGRKKGGTRRRGNPRRVGLKELSRMRNRRRRRAAGL